MKRTVVEFPAIVSVEVFEDDKGVALLDAEQYLHLAAEEWTEISLAGKGYAMSVFVDPQAEGKVSYQEEVWEGPTLFEELCQGTYESGQVFMDVMGLRWTFVQAYPLTRNARFINQESNDYVLLNLDELNTAGLEEIEGLVVPPITEFSRYNLNEAAFNEARDAGMSFEDCIKAAQRLKD